MKPNVVKALTAAYWAMGIAALAAVSTSTRGGSWAVDGVAFVAFGAVATGIVAHRPGHRWIWWLLASSILFDAGGGIVYQLAPHAAPGIPVPFVAGANVLLVAGYVCLVVALAATSAPVAGEGDPEIALDSAIVLVTTAAMMWAFVVDPLFLSAMTGGVDRVALAVHPFFDAFGVALVVRAVVIERRRLSPIAPIGLAVLSALAADLTLAFSATYGWATPWNVVETGWMFGALAIGAAALSPTMVGLTAPYDRVRRPGVGRISLLGVLMLLVPGAMCVNVVVFRDAFEPLEWMTATGVLTVLVTARLALLFRDKVRSEQAFALEQRRVKGLVEDLDDRILIAGEGGIVTFASPSAQRVFERVGRRWVGTDLRALVESTHLPSFDALVHRARANPGRPVTALLEFRDIGVGPKVFDTTVTDRHGDQTIGGLVVVLHDVTGQVAVERQLRHRALHDDLTGLPNRSLVLERLQAAMARGGHRSGTVVALYVDLDDFKDVNDTLGHQVGDELLKAVGARLSAGLRDADTVGRLGGDEFVVVAEDVAAVGGAGAVAERVRELLARPFTLGDGQDVGVTASIGIAASGETADSAADLVRRADLAVYRAKARGKRCAVTFEPAMQHAARQRFERSTGLRRALERDEFVLHYQPVHRLADRRLVGFEALVRWQHPDEGLLAPDAFVPLAEESGSIVEIGRWVLEEACRQALRFDARVPGVSMAVNVSARQLDSPALVDDVTAALASSGLEPGRLVLEVTETAVMRDPADALTRLLELKALGVRVAMDDFGTGFSSLGYLQELPIDVVKIDRSFVANLDKPNGWRLLHTMVQLGRLLQLVTLAEGIETQAQLAILQSLGCNEGQGFLFARPLEAEAAGELLGATPSRSRDAVVSV